MIGLLTLAAAAALQCTPEQAHYMLRNSPEVSADFRIVESEPAWPSGLALAVHNTRTGQTYWWLPWLGGTDGLQNVASTTDVTAPGWQPPSPDGGQRPFGNRQYLGFDANYDLIRDVPRKGAEAPSHMLFPDSAGSNDTAFQDKRFFDLVGCGPAR